MLPLIFLTSAAINNNLGPDPAVRLARETGEWSMRLLLLTLAMSPLKQLTRSSQWLQYRRILGLLTFFYACAHLAIYCLFILALEWNQLRVEILERPYITVGFFAWLILLPLALTSTRSWQRRLWRRWSRLHQWVYLSTFLSLMHLIWQIRSDIFEALVYTFLFLLLMSFRREKLFSSFTYFRRRGD